MYIYLDREKAKAGIVLVYAAFEERKEDFKDYYENKALEFKGDNLPHFITYINDEDTIREATEEEKLERGQRGLSRDEVVIDGKIVSYDFNTQKIIDNKIIEKTRQDYIDEELITLETEKAKARIEREKQFKALDLYDKAVLREDLKETEEMKKERDIFRKEWLELPNRYNDLNIPIEELYPISNINISYFL